MPTYQYACTDPECGNRFELVQAFTDPAASECPVCHHAVRKVYGSVGVVFKGSGFYRNDSRSESGSKSGSGSGPGSGEKSGSGETSTKSEPAAKSESSSTSDSGSSAKSGAKSEPAAGAAAKSA